MSDPNLDPSIPSSPAPPDASTPPVAPQSSFAPLPVQATPTPPVTGGKPFANEPIAPEPSRAASATNPLMSLLVGAVLSCGLVGFGVVIGRTGSGPSLNGVNAGSGNAIVQAVQKVSPAVMNVDSTWGADPKKNNFLPSPGQDPRESGPHSGKGTGFIIDSKKGLMLTNAHVVADAKKIQVTTRDGKTYAGRVMGFDRESDIAVVVLDNKSLPQAKLADFKSPSELPIGEWTIAIGNPYGQANTVTVGVLSAVGRELPVPENEGTKAFALKDMMQTDTAINPGNSGGPLCNLDGEVIGINTAINPNAQGIGYTIPINDAKRIADQIIAHGKVFHPYAGMQVKTITDQLKASLALPDKIGGLVTGVEPGSPAEKVGIESGDIVRSIDGKNMKSEDDIVNTLKGKKVGDSIKLEISHNGGKKFVTLKMGDRPD